MKLRIWVWLGAALLLSYTPLHAWLTARMWSHMLLHIPLLLLCGAGLSAASRQRHAPHWARWNDQGLSGLCALLVVLSLAMLPRTLDLVLSSPALITSKTAALLLAGALWADSLTRASLPLRLFATGMLLPMMGGLADWMALQPLRVCRAYTLQDQLDTAAALWWACAALGLWWLWLLLAPSRRSSQAQQPGELR
ncbi:hypothetical protein ACG0Z6_01960 [Roseateles sp. BYS180W]|uniref:Cytochrome c oxidase assembly protein n=1 Tax=Roseateles rivi TaxID=3299028 RepID=A0ABW7FRP3_9BURK